MAAPTTTSRQTPDGIKLDDGFSTKIACAADPDIAFWEKSVKAPGVDTGEPIDTSTMFNVQWRTFAERALLTLTPCSGKAAYDPVILTQILAIAGKNKEWTITFPEGSTWDFWGILNKFEPDELSEGTFPEASFTVTPTNQDNSGAEQAPVVASVPGT